MNTKLLSIIGLISTTILLSGCSIYGTYKGHSNNEYEASWVKVNPDDTFEYITWGHTTGYGYTTGSWKEKNDSIYLTQLEPKLPSTNQLIEIKDQWKNINLIRKDSTTLTPKFIKINGQLDPIKSDWEGNYSYTKYEKVDRIQVYEIGTKPGKVGQIIADFKTECTNCSYTVIVDWDKIGFKKIHNLDSVWLNKNNRLYPLNASFKGINNEEIQYYKRAETIKPFNFWIDSWNNMKNGFE